MAIVPKEPQQNFFHEAEYKIDNLSETKMLKILSHLEIASEEIEQIKEDENTVWYADIRSKLAAISSNISQLHSEIRVLISQKQVRESQLKLAEALDSPKISDLEKETLKTILSKHGFLPHEKG